MTLVKISNEEQQVEQGKKNLSLEWKRALQSLRMQPGLELEKAVTVKRVGTIKEKPMAL